MTEYTERSAVSAYEDSRIVDATADFRCCKCGDIMPRGYRHFVCVNGSGPERYHVHCAHAAKFKARCLEPTKRCQPLED